MQYAENICMLLKFSFFFMELLEMYTEQFCSHKKEFLPYTMVTTQVICGILSSFKRKYDSGIRKVINVIRIFLKTSFLLYYCDVYKNRK
jgi:hypothetical protein